MVLVGPDLAGRAVTQQGVPEPDFVGSYTRLNAVKLGTVDLLLR
jgi:hypothetical protein